MIPAPPTSRAHLSEAVSLMLGPIFLLVLVSVSPGCGEADAQARVLLPLSELPASAGPGAGGTWQSVGFDEDAWHRFDGQVELEIEHDLGRTPHLVMVYLSFSQDGTSAALAAGDLAVIRSVTDSAVTLMNQTREDFFCRLVLE